MKISSAEFWTSAPTLDDCPVAEGPEFAFIGRSNVGKSSLLNHLTGRKNLAKVSGRPGATRLINFFRIDRKWSLVDLPGYGYAKRGKGTRDEFEDMIADYLTGREALRCAFVLLSGELPPQQVDLEFCGWLALQGVPFVLVFTKADKVKKGRLEANVAAFLEEFAEYCDGEPRVFLSSAKNGEGRRELLAFLSQAM